MDDTCYFNTYLKEYPITYITEAGTVSKPVNLCSCHIVLMLDNLVRLKFRNDPDLGECRSKQICTLPITIQGVPKDASEVSSWHDYRICDGTSDCPCKEVTSLLKADIPKITGLREEEERILLKFRNMSSWGHQSMWSSIETSRCIQDSDKNRFQTLFVIHAFINISKCSQNHAQFLPRNILNYLCQLCSR